MKMNKTSKVLIATTLLIALSACDDESNPFTQTDPVNDQPVPPVVNTDPEVDAPDIGDPEIDDPEIDGPVTEGPVGGFDINAMVNGTSETDFQTFWACYDVGETDPDAYFTMRFYADARGAYAGGGVLIEFNWAYTDNNIDFALPNDSRNFRFANIAFESNGFISTDFEVTDADTSALNCELLDLDGNLVY